MPPSERLVQSVSIVSIFEFSACQTKHDEISEIDRTGGSSDAGSRAPVCGRCEAPNPKPETLNPKP